MVAHGLRSPLTITVASPSSLSHLIRHVNMYTRDRRLKWTREEGPKVHNQSHRGQRCLVIEYYENCSDELLSLSIEDVDQPSRIEVMQVPSPRRHPPLPVFSRLCQLVNTTSTPLISSKLHHLTMTPSGSCFDGPCKRRHPAIEYCKTQWTVGENTHWNQMPQIIGLDGLHSVHVYILRTGLSLSPLSYSDTASGPAHTPTT